MNDKFGDLIGKPYKENGRGPGGYDCYGVCVTVCNRLGITIPEVDQVSRKPFSKVREPLPGDLVLIVTEHGKHVGVMENQTQLITVHSKGRRGVHRMRLSHPWVRDRIEGIYRYEG